MKKVYFYSIMMVHGEKKAVLHYGYTDGIFNYYKEDNGYWYAIHPLCGLDVGVGNTRKNAQEEANKKDFSKVNDEYMNKQIDIFNDYVSRETLKER